MNYLFNKNISNKDPTKDITDDDLKNKLILSTDKKKKFLINFKNKKLAFNNKTLPIIAGPNGIENREMLFKTAKFLKKQKINFFRVHTFKPLTFPYRSSQYSDTGYDGLNWIKELRKYYSFIFVSEITELQHLEALSETVDILQIGSRNMQNFELLRECAKTKKTIILKRHFGTGIRDWLAAAEHILVQGNNKVILCERGVAAPHTHRSTSRYMLDLQAITAVKEISNLPVISDPSHASFWAKWVPNLAYASVGAGCDGLIIEMHPDPKNSKVDPLQPLSFKQFNKLIIDLKGLAKFFGRKII